MTSARRYQLLCPVGRSLDAVGDRWSLLILRDLHAGPARFKELEDGLGIAPNLLTTRLADLIATGLVRRSSDRPRSPYELTDHGRATDRLLWELVRFGSTIDPDPETRPPGNLRTLALPLRMVLEQVPDRPEFVSRLVVDGDSFVIRSTTDAVEVVYGDSTSPVDEEVETSYEPFLDLGEGRLAPEDFMTHHVHVVSRADRAPQLFEVLGRAMAARQRA